MNSAALPASSRAASTAADHPKKIIVASGRHASEIRSAAWWADHFHDNHARDWRIPWDSPAALSREERRRVAASIPEFQRGESSEARCYLTKSSLYSLEYRDPDFHHASVLFVREENGHAALLLRFMNGAGISPRASAFSDSVFRRVRAFGDLAWSSRVLLVAELVAQEYYPCLRSATAHPALRRICDKLIHDEFAHIRFQVERIARLESALPPARRRLREHLQGALLVGAAFAVYRAHRPVLARIGFLAFLRRLFRRFHRAARAIRSLSAQPVLTAPGPIAASSGPFLRK